MNYLPGKDYAHETRVITDVESTPKLGGGWVHFADPNAPDDAARQFRRSTEVHAVATGRKPVVGDRYTFRVYRNLAGQFQHAYPPEGQPAADPPA